MVMAISRIRIFFLENKAFSSLSIRNHVNLKEIWIIQILKKKPNKLFLSIYQPACTLWDFIYN